VQHPNISSFSKSCGAKPVFHSTLLSLTHYLEGRRTGKHIQRFVTNEILVRALLPIVTASSLLSLEIKDFARPAVSSLKAIATLFFRLPFTSSFI
jgi:hypothetical protein